MAKRIDITTAQNVVIDYKAASVTERFFAWALDIVFLALIIGALSIIILIITPAELQRTVMIYTITPLSLLYHLLSEIFLNGASLGKQIVGLRVVKINAEPVSIYDYFLRWAFRIIDISGSFGILGAITISSSPKNQRIGDYLADTAVIKISKTDRFALYKITELDSLSQYEPQYPEVTTFSEGDMLVIKEVIDRNNRYDNEVYKNILYQTIDHIEQTLGIKAKTRNIEFLKTLIKDYVALTR